MPIVIIVVGIMLIVTALNNKLSTLSQLLQDDWAPQEKGVVGFPIWLAAIGLIGLLGYIKPLKPLSMAFMVLIFVVLFLTKGGGSTAQGVGFFTQLFSFVKTTSTQSASTASQAGAATGPSLSAGDSIQSVIQSFTPNLEGNSTAQFPNPLSQSGNSIDISNAAQQLFAGG